MKTKNKDLEFHKKIAERHQKAINLIRAHSCKKQEKKKVEAYPEDKSAEDSDFTNSLEFHFIGKEYHENMIKTLSHSET